MSHFDYVIVGAGSAGCVLAYRLSENPGTKVLLLEAGPPDNDPGIHRPKGYLVTHGDPRLTWRFPTTVAGEGGWRGALTAGRTLGGTSAINSMIYVRGQPQDYDDWAAGGAVGWAWRDIEPCFRKLEDYAPGADGGRGGPLHVGAWRPHDRFSDAVIAAGVEAGLEAKDDLNAGAPGGIGYFAVSVRDGRRVTSADAFLRPVLNRPNLTVITDRYVDRIEFNGLQATGVSCAGPEGRTRFHAGRDVIVCCGALQSPKLLQLSGVGPAVGLRRLGIEVVRDSPGVGANLCERWAIRVQHRMAAGAGHNHQLSGLGLRLSRLRYALSRSGIMATASTEIGAFAAVSPDSDRPDVEIQIGGASTVQGVARQFERAAGMRCIVSPLRPQSRGSVMIVSPDPAVAPVVDLNVLATDADRQLTVRGLHFVRGLLRQPSLAPYLREEIRPGEACRSDAEIIEEARRHGEPKSHFAGACKMGDDPMAVVDPRLRVRGVGGLRVVDASIMPSLVSGNTHGPVTAMAWRAADLIAEDWASGGSG